MADDVVLINVEEGSKRVVNNTKLYAKLLAKFMEDPSFNNIGIALAEGNIESAKGHTHTLKGLAANLSLSELYKQCVELEVQIKSGSVKPEQVACVNNVYAQTIIEVEKVIAQYA